MLKLEQPSPGVGVIATGVDVTRMTDAQWAALYRAWLDHSLLVVRGQQLDIGQFLAYGRRFGRVKQAGLPYWAGPHKEGPGEINRHWGGRGVYFNDPNGHLLELITKPYGDLADL